MKILFLTHSFGESGTYWRCIFLARYLVARGHHVTIVARGPSNGTIRCNKWQVETVFLPGWRIQWLKRLPFVLGENFDIIRIFAATNFCNSLPGLFAKLFKKGQILVDWDDWWTKGGLVQGAVSAPIITVMEEKMPLLALAVTVVSEALRRRALRCSLTIRQEYCI
ncbi:MAG: glycosyltransferase [Nitrososphaerales archaeon]